MARILILIGGHLCTAPRPQKEATALSRAGHEVLVVGHAFDPELVKRDEEILASTDYALHYVSVGFAGGTLRQRLTRQAQRVLRKIALERFRRFRHTTPDLLGFAPQATLRFALRHRADLTMVHSEAGLWVGSKLLDRRLRVGADFEDWFSEDLSVEARRHRPVSWIAQLERRLLREGKPTLTTSQALADNLAHTNASPTPVVIPNVFPRSDLEQIDQKRIDRIHDPEDSVSLHWFSQTIGPGRGLENVLEALRLLPATARIRIHLRGNLSPSGEAWLNSLRQGIPETWIHIHPTVPNAELLSRIAEHDIGLALEQREPPSRDLTITNKFFQYLQGGLALLATPTAGQKEAFAASPNVGQLLTDDRPETLARAITTYLEDRPRLAAAQAEATRIAQNEHAFEAFETRLVASIAEGLL